MRDYVELVKALRHCAADGDGDCDTCPYSTDAKACSYERMMNTAADAIEELLAAVPHWISVEERLPEKDEMVIVYYSWIGQSGTEYKEVSLATLEEMRYCGSKLLGWMPLPAPPKEELNKNVE